MRRHYIFTLVLLATTNSLFSWQFMVHFITGFNRLGGTTSSSASGNPIKYAGLYNLPDIWDNMPTIHILDTTYPAIWEGWYITDEFCWSHAVKRDGNTWTVPNKPETTYHFNPSNDSLTEDDLKDPGHVIMDLIQKMNATNEEIQLFEATAEYFLIHNRADAVVHYRYFGGAQDGMNLLNCIEAWRIGHARKERWADVSIAAISRDSNGNKYLVFHSTGDNAGKVKSFCGIKITDYDNQIIAPLPSSAISPKIIILAQLVARKNRQILDTGNSPERYQTINSTSDILRMVAYCEAENNRKLRETTVGEFNELCENAINNGWISRNQDGTYNFNDLTIEFERALRVTR